MPQRPSSWLTKKCGRLVERIMAKRNKHVRIIVFSEDVP